MAVWRTNKKKQFTCSQPIKQLVTAALERTLHGGGNQTAPEGDTHRQVRYGGKGVQRNVSFPTLTLCTCIAGM